MAALASAPAAVSSVGDTPSCRRLPLDTTRRGVPGWAAGSALLQSGCASGSPAAAGDQTDTATPAFDVWSDAFAADWVRLSPEGATIRQHFCGAEQAALDRQLTPQTAEHCAQSQSLALLADLAPRTTADAGLWRFPDGAAVDAQALAGYTTTTMAAEDIHATGLPKWRQRRVVGGGSAHAEGWALYAERLAIDSGWYEGDPVGLLGALDSQLFRARRLVVDTGLHAKRWTREQAIDDGIGAPEVERDVAMPGQACAYMIGMLRILELRDAAQTALGRRFDLKAFHDMVLSTGSVPLDVLGGVTQRWMAAVVRGTA